MAWRIAPIASAAYIRFVPTISCVYHRTILSTFYYESNRHLWLPHFISVSNFWSKRTVCSRTRTKMITARGKSFYLTLQTHVHNTNTKNLNFWNVHTLKSWFAGCMNIFRRHFKLKIFCRQNDFALIDISVTNVLLLILYCQYSLFFTKKKCRLQLEDKINLFSTSNAYNFVPWNRLIMMSEARRKLASVEPFYHPIYINVVRRHWLSVIFYRHDQKKS